MTREAGSNQSDDPPDSPRRRNAARATKPGPEHSPERRVDPVASLTPALNGIAHPAPTKYVVRDPERDSVLAVYEHVDGEWRFWEAEGPPYLWHQLANGAGASVETVLEAHRNRGLVVSRE